MRVQQGELPPFEGDGSVNNINSIQQPTTIPLQSLSQPIGLSKIKFIFEKRIENIKELERTHEGLIIEAKGDRLGITIAAGEDDSIKLLIIQQVSELVKEWHSESISLYDVYQELATIIKSRVEKRSADDRSVTLDIEVIDSIESDLLKDITINMHGISSGVKRLKDQINRSITPVSKSPTVSSKVIRGLIADSVRAQEEIQTFGAFLQDRVDSFTLHSLNQSDWDRADMIITSLASNSPSPSSLPTSSSVVQSPDSSIQQKTTTDDQDAAVATPVTGASKEIKFTKVLFNKHHFHYLSKIGSHLKWIDAKDQKLLKGFIGKPQQDGTVSVSGEDCEEIKKIINDDLKPINSKFVEIELPFSVEIIYKDHILAYAKSKKTYVSWKHFDNPESYWSNVDNASNTKKKENNNNNITTTTDINDKKKKYGQKDFGNAQKGKGIIKFYITSPSRDDNDSTANFIIGLSKLKQIISLGDEEKKITYNFSKFKKEGQLVYISQGTITIEALSELILGNVVTEVKDYITSMKKSKVEIKLDPFEGEYLNQKKVFDFIKKRYPTIKLLPSTTTPIEAPGTVTIEGNPDKINEVNQFLAQTLENFKVVPCAIEDDYKPKAKLLAAKITSIKKRTDQDSFIHYKIFGEFNHIDFKSLVAFGNQDESDILAQEIKSYNDTLIQIESKPDNIKQLIGVLVEKKELKEKIENHFNANIVIDSSQGIIRITAESTEDAKSIEQQLQNILSNQPKDTKEIQFTLIIYKTISKLLFQEKNVIVKFNNNNFTAIITGEPKGVALVHQKIMEEKKKFESLMVSEVMTIDQNEYELLFGRRFKSALQKQCELSITPACKQIINLTLPSQRSLSIKTGKLEVEVVDAIVNPANAKLANIGGAAAAISRAAGPQLEKQCSEYIKQNNEVPVGTSYITSSFDISSCSFIIHTVGPNTSTPTENSQKEHLLKKSIFSSLEMADKNQLSSIALPAISSGIFGYNIKESAPVMISAALCYLERHADTVKDVRFVDTNVDTLSHLKIALNKQQKDLSNSKISFTSESINYNTSTTIAPLSYSWSWQENNGLMIPYDREQAEQIEGAYLARQPSVYIVGDLNCVKNGVDYYVYFKDFNNVSTWYQERKSNGITKRLVTRTQLFTPQPTVQKNRCFPQPQQHQQQHKQQQESAKFEIKISGRKESINMFKQELKKLMVKHINSITIEKNLQQEDQQEIMGIADSLGVTMIKVDNGYALKGLLDKVTEIQILILGSSTNQVIVYPPLWQKDKKKDYLDLPRGPVWDKIQERMKISLNCTITRIQFIQNDEVFIKFYQRRELLKLKGVNPNEMELFHGTSGTDPKMICHGSDGFDFRFSNDGCMWGNGNYFAVNASYSDRYAFTPQQKQKQFIWALVLTGNSYNCPPTRFKIPPFLNNSQQDRYDSVSGNTNGSDIFITYDNALSYPYYLITYESQQ